MVGDLTLELSEYKTSRGLVNLVGSENKTKKYEYLNCLERWILSWVNMKYHKNQLIFQITKKNMLINQKLLRELAGKNIDSPDDLLGKIMTVSNDVKMIPYVSSTVSYQKNILVLDICDKRESIMIAIQLSPTKIRELQKYDDDCVVRMVLKYETLINGGQQWRLPEAQYEHLYNKYDVRYEGFASPLNSGISSMDNARFCSIFEDTDTIFGSIGNFFKQTLYCDKKNNDKQKIYKQVCGVTPRHWSINPPFIESLLLKTSNKIIRDITYAAIKSLDVMVVYIMPVWEDFNGYQMIKNFPFMKKHVILGKRKHFYEHMGERKIVSVESAMFVIDTYENTNDDNYSDIASPMII